MNICKHLKCPFHKSHGCIRFATSWQCPVGLQKEHQRRHPEISSHQFALFCQDDADININHLREILNREVLANEMSVAIACAELDDYSDADNIALARTFANK